MSPCSYLALIYLQTHFLREQMDGGVPVCLTVWEIPLAAVEASRHGSSTQEKPFAVCVLPWVVQHTADVLEKGHTSKQREAFSQFFQKSDI